MRTLVALILTCVAGRGVPILVLSARTDEAHKIDAMDAGADDCLTKPVGTGELLARVRPGPCYRFLFHLAQLSVTSTGGMEF